MKRIKFHRLKELTKASFRKYFITFVKMKGTPPSPNVLDINSKVNNSKDFVCWTEISLYPLKEIYNNRRELRLV